MTISKKPSPLLHLVLWSILALAVAGFVFSYFYSSGKTPEPEAALPVNSTIPPFTLTERSDRPVSLDDLKGHIWIANFIFTTCPAACGAMSNRMKEVQTALEKNPEVKMVSFTVDPQKDTPAVLRTYAENHGADPNRWLFLTGQQKTIYDIAYKGFLLGFQETTGEQAVELGKYTHSTRFALVDDQGRVRAYYDAFDDNLVPQILAGIDSLQHEKKIP